MRYYLGCIHAAPEVLSLCMDPKAVLSRRELDSMRGMIIGCPITFLHSGWKEAVMLANAEDDTVIVPTSSHVYRKLDELSVRGGKYVIGGRVVDYFSVPNGGYYIIFSLDNATLERLVDTGVVAGLSLTHNPLVQRGVAVPYEVTLCVLPMRLMSCVRATGQLSSLITYKRKLMDGTIPEHIMNPPEIVDDLSTALSSLPPSVAGIIAAKFSEADKARIKAQKEAEDAQTALNANSQATANEFELLNGAIKELQGLLGEEMCSLYGLDSCRANIASENRHLANRSFSNVIAASITSLRQSKLEQLKYAQASAPSAPPAPTRTSLELPTVEPQAASMSKKRRVDEPPEGLSDVDRIKYSINTIYGV